MEKDQPPGAPPPLPLSLGYLSQPTSEGPSTRNSKGFTHSQNLRRGLEESQVRQKLCEKLLYQEVKPKHMSLFPAVSSTVLVRIKYTRKYK